MTPVQLVRPHPRSCRVYVYGRRLHHGLTGCLMVAAGLALIAHDWADRPWPTTDPSPRRATT